MVEAWWVLVYEGARCRSRAVKRCMIDRVWWKVHVVFSCVGHIKSLRVYGGEVQVLW